MKIIEGNGYKIILSDGFSSTRDCVLALGDFDGVHIAHAELINSALKLKEKNKISLCGVWCFEENPLKFFISDAPKQILSNREKFSIFFNMGVDFCVIADFHKFKDSSPYDFTRHLQNDLGCVGVVCGYNFRFAHDRLGNPQFLREPFGEENIVIVDKIELDGIPVSSTQIRKFISQGDMENTCKFLGKPYYINTTVRSGKQMGRTISFPTANQYFPSECIIPKFGVYATVCTTENGKQYIGVSNVGIRPTIFENDTHSVNCETYIVDFNGDIYGQKLKVEFYKILRLEQKFSSVEELRLAIDTDAKNAVAYFEAVGGAL